MKNILLIGNSVKDIAEDIWKINTNTYCISSDNLEDGNLRSFIHQASVPIICVFDEKNLEKTEVNTLMDFCENNNFTPMFISTGNKCLAHCAFLTLNDRYRESMEYETNADETDLDEFKHICVAYMEGRVDDDSTIRPSEGR